MLQSFLHKTLTNLSGAQPTPPPLAYFPAPSPKAGARLSGTPLHPRQKGLPGKLRIPVPTLPSPILTTALPEVQVREMTVAPRKPRTESLRKYLGPKASPYGSTHRVRGRGRGR